MSYSNRLTAKPITADQMREQVERIRSDAGEPLLLRSERYIVSPDMLTKLRDLDAITVDGYIDWMKLL
jgi:hypothetical protein